jgi:Cellulase M and related proteins
MELLDLTRKLCCAAGPSGFEKPVLEAIEEYLTPYADEISTDCMGNYMAVKRCGHRNARLVMLTAHMDEIGLIVTGAEEGFLRFETLGGVDKRMLAAREVLVLGPQTLFGVIDTIPPHLQGKNDGDTASDTDRLYIDVGLTQDEALKAAPAGTPIVFAGTCEELGNGCVCGKAIDDRSCVAIVLKAFELLSAHELGVDVSCLISTQEEVGQRGASVGAWSMRPDVALAIDVTFAKTPDAREVLCDIGKGAAIGIGPNMNRAVTEELFHLAKEKQISHQPEVTPGGNSGTDAYAIQISRGGVATALISLPIKYMHTPVEVAKLDDMESIQRLLVEYVLQAGEAENNA